MTSMPHEHNRNSGLYIPFFADMPEHPKIRKLSRALNVTRDQACLYVLRLHHWAQKYSRQGDTSGDDAAADIAEFVNWPGDPAELLAALSAARFIDPDGRLHDWPEYGGKVFAKRASDRKRQADSRANRKDTSQGSHSDSGVTSQGSHGEVTVMSRPKIRQEEKRKDQRKKDQSRADDSRAEQTAPAPLNGAADEHFLHTDFDSDFPPISESDNGRDSVSGEGAESERERPSVGFPLRYGKSENDGDSPEEPDYLSDAPDSDDDTGPDDDPALTTALYLESLTAAEVAAYRTANPDDPGVSLYAMRARNRAAP